MLPKSFLISASSGSPRSLRELAMTGGVVNGLMIWLAGFFVLPAYAAVSGAGVSGTGGTTMSGNAPGTISGTVSGVTSNLTAIGADQMILNIASQVPFVMSMVTAFAYVLGMYLIIAGIMKMKHLGEMRTQMSQEHSVKQPLILLATGALLLYLPSSVQVGMSTFWNTPNPYGYTESTDQWSDMISSCLTVVQLFGTIAFIRGLIILSHLGGHQGGGQNSFAKGMTHIIGGLMCINIYQFVQVVFITLGIQT